MSPEKGVTNQTKRTKKQRPPKTEVKNQNQVTKVLCRGRDEKHLKSIIFIFLNLNNEAVGLTMKNSTKSMSEMR